MANSWITKLERWFLFDPETTTDVRPIRQGAIDVMVEGLRVRWYRLVNDPEAPVILYAYGNGGSLDTRAHIVSMFQEFGRANLVMFDYTGFGRSIGVPSQQKVTQDILIVYDYLTTGNPFDRPQAFTPDQIVGWGESFGGAVIASLAQDRPQLKGIVLMSTFPSLSWMAQHLYGPLMKTIFRWSCVDYLDTMTRLRETIRLPVVVLHSHDDGFIPIDAGIDLVRAYPSETTRLIVINGTHYRPVITTRQMNEIWIGLGF